MMINQPINLDELYEIDGGKYKLVTNPEPVDKNKNTFNIDGIFSSRIFGSMNDSLTNYSCDCGHLSGEFNLGNVCHECNSEVLYRGLSITKEGWVNLHHVQIHPLFYRYISRIVGGKAAMEKVLKYDAKILGNGIHETPEILPPYNGIGIKLFHDNFDEIINYFFEKRGKKHIFEYNFINKYRDAVFCNYFIVINSRLRPAIVVNGEFSFDKINILYNSLLRTTSTHKELSSLERIPINLENLAYKTQEAINDIYINILENISNKEGAIRGDLLGNRLNFTSRMVITPCDADKDLDNVDFPYLAALELLKPAILKRLVSLRNYTYHDALVDWHKATTIFDEVIYKIMCKLAKSDNVRVICNRNPTIAIGSMVLLKIGEIKRDMNDMTASIHNLILSPLAGDYDGCTLYTKP